MKTHITTFTGSVPRLASALDVDGDHFNKAVLLLSIALTFKVVANVADINWINSPTKV